MIYTCKCMRAILIRTSYVGNRNLHCPFGHPYDHALALTPACLCPHSHISPSPSPTPEFSFPHTEVHISMSTQWHSYRHTWRDRDAGTSRNGRIQHRPTHTHADSRKDPWMSTEPHTETQRKMQTHTHIKNTGNRHGLNMCVGWNAVTVTFNNSQLWCCYKFMGMWFMWTVMWFTIMDDLNNQYIHAGIDWW